jgi:PAS domain-containing protein
VFGRDTTRAIRQPGSAKHPVIRVEGVFPAIVSRQLFDHAHDTQHRYSTRLTDDELLEAMRDLWRRKGRITSALLFADRDTPTPQVYLHRFGSLRAAYKMIGYVQERDLSFGDVRDRMRVWLPSVMGFVADMLTDTGSTVQRQGRVLAVDATWTVLFQLMQSSRMGRGEIRWVVPQWHGVADLYVGIRMDVPGDYPLDYLIIPAVGSQTWPTVISEVPDASARCYLFPSLGLFRRLSAVTRAA